MFKTVDSVLKSFNKMISDLEKIAGRETAAVNAATAQAEELYTRASKHEQEAHRANAIKKRLQDLVSDD